MAFDLPIATATLWMETRGEPEEGQRAVAHVIVNRMHSGRWGRNLAAVCLARLQFSCWNEGDPNRMALASIPDDDATLKKLAGFLQNALMGAPDPTNGALNYFNPKLSDPPWAKGKPFVAIGNHRFLTA